MSTNTIPVIKFLFREELKVLGDALSIGPGFETEEFSNSNDLSTYLSTVPAGLVVTSLYDRNDLIQIATFMKLGKKIAKDCTLKIVVFNFSKDRNFEKAIAKLGILDVVEPGINTKALKFKIDFWMKSLNAQVKNSANVNPQKVKTLEHNKGQEKKGPDISGINWLDPLELEDDIWLLKNDTDCKKVLSKWLIRLLGPSPYIGQWTEVKSGLWRFDVKESEKEMFVPNEGAWFFEGDQKPDFVWKENIWLISGDNFELSFRNSKEVYSRFNCKNRVIQVCKNSMYAKTKESAIIESFDKELVFKREAEKLEDMEGKNNTDLIDNSNLEGKSKTDEIDGGPLQGKNKTAAERSGNLSGKTKGHEAINHENLEQETSTSREKTHWNNKNSYSEEDKAQELSVNSEKHRDGDNLERANKDHEHKKYYKNHNEAEKYEAGELGKDLGGKSSTDKLESHYGRKGVSPEAQKAVEKAETELKEAKSPEARGKAEKALNEAKTRAEKEAGEFSEKETKDLGGKSSTDKLASHYGRAQDQANAKEAIEKAERAIKEAKTPEASAKAEKELKEAKEKAFKSRPEAREAIEKAEKALKEAKTPEAKAKADKELKEAKELAGKSSTDTLASHYGRSEREALPEVSPREHFDRLRKSPETKTKKNEQSDAEERSKKTALDKDHEGDHDYGFKGEDPATYRNTADVLPLNKAREERNKQKSPEEKALDRLTEDAKVISFITHNGRKISCGLDDFFDDTLIFHTDDLNIEMSSDVNLDLKFKFLEKDTNLKIGGNVITIDDDGEGKNFVTIQLSRENAKAFDTFMKLYEIRQQNVNEFLKKTKGV